MASSNRKPAWAHDAFANSIFLRRDRETLHARASESGLRGMTTKRQRVDILGDKEKR
jgi:hypothetical protein